MIGSENKKPFKILLIGDNCIDEYVYGICSRLNPEAPVPVLDYTRTETKPGMAANVFENLKTFKVDVEFITNKEKIIKTRFVDDKYNHQILRVDRHEVLTPLTQAVFDTSFDAIVISDYNKGFISESKLFEIVDQAHCPVFIDTKKRVIPDKPNCYIKINESEYNSLDNPPVNTIATLGDKGAMYQGKIYPTDKVTVFDVVGAGDTFLAALTYFYLLLGSIEKAIPYANKAAAIVVQHIGTYVLTEEDVASIIKD
ncbi:PfkB family carbohydrate kinase [Ferruginibacter lapsinanis]|uniref:bifunctional heptose 7-phosphate kinase/heptose 1-phosphate adenyltransferase n=1 Tax=Ferruginibacter lapsinanis TaxID=563172 RepID=UPI001E2E8635|nr:PfkB family carbohydrate kinase [Ferruginibacter lapsinanis]UEG48811.1 PfkB family carbohydrate kinase [Ferruginibacter lapsinanis]